MKEKSLCSKKIRVIMKGLKVALAVIENLNNCSKPKLTIKVLLNNQHECLNYLFEHFSCYLMPAVTGDPSSDVLLISNNLTDAFASVCLIIYLQIYSIYINC